ncbi:helix-turn-helix domain-containing protein [Gloeobacter morelensis]|uniref:AraC family transcriptional regulator n=1 Tax=Gloeobacter morelensis MG652769 TaxID=2781736 RepID=A0ABY3PID8_9CYAN|nr:helix-turn-helix domain-containing protein [Gloeobacter morelensis]UFP93389.1 AraC family transcriptional regulator [Gloeobacter morelensis MG652769]
MQFLVLPPHPALARFVAGYWFVEDLDDANQGRPIHTAPHTHAVLTVHFGRPNTDESGVAVPRVSLLGVQSRARTWHSDGCYFVMVMLNVPGFARLFPHTGADSRDNLLDVEALLGARATRFLSGDLIGVWGPENVARRLDAWFLGRLASREPPSRFERFEAAWRTLRGDARIDAAAAAAGVSPRQLERWFDRHIGHSPKQLLCQERVIASLQATQTGSGDPLAGFSDQAHQIRSWKRYLGRTPGHYSRMPAREIARHFSSDSRFASAGLALYL